MQMSLNTVDLLCLGLDAWTAAKPKPKPAGPRPPRR